MTTPKRNQVLTANANCRKGSNPVRRLDDGYVSLRIPTADFQVLRFLYPELNHPDPDIRLAAWKQLEASEVGDKYRVTQRSPKQVQRAARYGNQGIIVK